MTREDKIEACARAAHEVNRAYCFVYNDLSQLSWYEAPNWQRESSTKGVEFALTGKTPEQQHEAWVKDKEDDGWKYGPVKDPDKKEHPCMVPYDQLPEMQKNKDLLFVVTVRTMAKVLGL